MYLLQIGLPIPLCPLAQLLAIIPFPFLYLRSWPPYYISAFVIHTIFQHLASILSPFFYSRSFIISRFLYFSFWHPYYISSLRLHILSLLLCLLLASILYFCSWPSYFCFSFILALDLHIVLFLSFILFLILIPYATQRGLITLLLINFREDSLFYDMTPLQMYYSVLFIYYRDNPSLYIFTDAQFIAVGRKYLLSIRASK